MFKLTLFIVFGVMTGTNAMQWNPQNCRKLCVPELCQNNQTLIDDCTRNCMAKDLSAECGGKAINDEKEVSDLIAFISKLPRRDFNLDSLIPNQVLEIGKKIKEKNKDDKTKDGVISQGDEDAFVKDLEDDLEKGKLSPPKTWTINQIDIAYRKVMEANYNPSHTKPEFIMVKGIGALDLQNYEIGQNSFVQAASQFNYLEAMGEYISPVYTWITDYTQGPQASIQSLSACLYRIASVYHGQLDNALINILPDGVDKSMYKDGWFYPQRFKDEKELYQTIRQNIGNLRVLPQLVKCERTGKYQIQVFSAAPILKGTSDINTTIGAITEFLVAEQYAAIAKMLVIQKMMNPNKRVVGNFTLVGQGVFNNPSEIMTSCFDRVADIIGGHDIEIYIHGHRSLDPIKEFSKNTSHYTLREVLKEDLK